jgi:hypothetical protein
MDDNDILAEQETASAVETNPVPSPETSGEEQGGFGDDAQAATIPQPAQTQAQAEQQFLAGSTLDPTKLPPEIQPIFKKMQGAYTKKMQEAARWREHSEMVERFQNDRDYGFQTVAQWAARNGYSIAPVGQQHPQPQAQPTYQRPGQPDPGIVEAIKANLPPELQWMAESTAPAIQQAVNQMLAPLAQQLQQNQAGVQRQVMEREWDDLASQLSDVAPGWEEHEPQMTELLNFFQGSTMKHPKFGSKHQLLYNLVTGNAAATAQVTKRMQQAATNRPSSGITTGRTTTNLVDRIRATKSSQDAFKLAAQAAEGRG